MSPSPRLKAQHVCRDNPKQKEKVGGALARSSCSTPFPLPGSESSCSEQALFHVAASQLRASAPSLDGTAPAMNRSCSKHQLKAAEAAASHCARASREAEVRLVRSKIWHSRSSVFLLRANETAPCPGHDAAALARGSTAWLTSLVQDQEETTNSAPCSHEERRPHTLILRLRLPRVSRPLLRPLRRASRPSCRWQEPRWRRPLAAPAAVSARPAPH